MTRAFGEPGSAPGSRPGLKGSHPTGSGSPDARSVASALLADMLEREWDALLFGSQKGLAPILGWRLCYHTLRSKGSQSGFPDRVLVRDRIIYVELKRDKGKPTPAQKEWLDALSSAGAETYLWRPGDLDEIAKILSTRWKFEKALDGRRLLRTELTSMVPQSLWLPGVGRVDEAAEQRFQCVVDESTGVADA